MATTPEGKVKASIKRILDPLKPALYYDMPVPSGYGKSTLDFIGCYYGYYFAIEAKAGKKIPTERQDGTIDDMQQSGAVVFVVNDVKGLDVLEDWLTEIRRVAI
jgi:hypothetical protein